jgi:hypothetical protein
MMNEQIEKLVKQFAEDLMKKSGYDMRELEPFIEESRVFAESIVRECANEIIKQNGDVVVLDDWDRGYDAGLQCAISVIKEHFGVEK